MATAIAKASSLEAYLSEINHFPLLTREEEYDLANRYREFNDLDAAQRGVLLKRVFECVIDVVAANKPCILTIGQVSGDYIDACSRGQ